MIEVISNIENNGIIEIENKVYTNNIFITPWTLMHFISGYILYTSGFNYLYGFIIHTIYEYINLTNESLKKKWNKIYDGFKKDSIINSLGDTIFFMLGMFLAKNYFNKYVLYFLMIVGIIFLSPFTQNIIIQHRYDFINNIFPNLKNNSKEIIQKVDIFLIIWIFYCILTLFKIR